MHLVTYGNFGFIGLSFLIFMLVFEQCCDHCQFNCSCGTTDEDANQKHSKILHFLFGFFLRSCGGGGGGLEDGIDVEATEPTQIRT
jgi:hypothetical protein